MVVEKRVLALVIFIVWGFIHTADADDCRAAAVTEEWLIVKRTNYIARMVLLCRWWGMY